VLGQQMRAVGPADAWGEAGDLVERGACGHVDDRIGERASPDEATLVWPGWADYRAGERMAR
jgi:hypothetical protein